MADLIPPKEWTVQGLLCNLITTDYRGREAKVEAARRLFLLLGVEVTPEIEAALAAARARA